MTPVATLSRRTASERRRLFNHFRSKIAPNPELDRTVVSFQANRHVPFYKWFKYKEAFSAELVRYVLDRFGGKKNGVLLDPFAGVGTALLVARERGWNSVGIELLPVGAYAINTRLAAESVKVETFRRHLNFTCENDWTSGNRPDFAIDHIPITSGAFPAATERAIANFRAYCAESIREPKVRCLFTLGGMAILESASFTRKDGQYLRWDARSGRDRIKSGFDKGRILDFNTAISAKLRQMHEDLRTGNRDDGFFANTSSDRGEVELCEGSCLSVLRSQPTNSVDLVMTSPPYCNRYDYTRTYALELVYLGLSNDEIRDLRQAMLSCTVENREKTDELRWFYEKAGASEIFQEVTDAFQNQRALHEVLAILNDEAADGRINNVNIPRMVRNYFYETAFVIYELSRVLRPGGRIIMVNDNVRYAGEEIPVDTILSDFATRFGMEVEHIWTLTRGKGNSSQQMGAHGRSELRKCVYVWRKN